jgi:glycine oxidase
VTAAGSSAGCIRVRQAPRFAVRPIRGQLLYLRWSAETRLSRVVWGADCYVVPRADDIVLAGATVEDGGLDESATVEGVAAMTRAATELQPAIGPSTRRRTWWLPPATIETASCWHRSRRSWWRRSSSTGGPIPRS